MLRLPQRLLSNMKWSIHCHCAVLALVIGCLGGPATAGPVGTVETFEGDAVGNFPANWSDVALVDPDPLAPKPSAVVVSTTDAFGNSTNALAPVPAVGGIQGIYRTITPSNFYSTRADIRVDQFSDFDPNFDPTICGCPPGSEVDFPVGVTLMQSATTTFHLWPTVQLYPGARSQDWRLFVGTANAVADLDLGLPVTLGKWYGVELDLDANAATARSRITDLATGATLLDTVTLLSALGSWDPAIDGRFDIEAFWDAEISAKTTPGLWVIDNIDAPIPEPGTILLLGSALAVGAVVRRRKWGSGRRRRTALRANVAVIDDSSMGREGWSPA
jgi:hypothetical protein